MGLDRFQNGLYLLLHEKYEGQDHWIWLKDGHAWEGMEIILLVDKVSGGLPDQMRIETWGIE